MRVKYATEPFPYVLIDELYNEWELEELWEEMDYLCSPRRLMVADTNNGSATDPNGELLKFTHCQYLEDVYKNRNHSAILQITEKIFMEDSTFFMNHPHWFFPGTAANTNQHYTQLVYYENNDEYKSHRDCAQFTVLNWFYRKPKKFSGGNLCFEDFDLEIECLNNRTLIFPSVINHAAKPVIMEEKYVGQKYGRFCISQFVSRQF